MTPAARLSAAIGVLDRILAGEPAEQALTNWGRASRYAGSGDRNAVRDLVFDALRCRRSFAALGGGETGRGLILGGQRAAGNDLGALFTGEAHAPAPLTAADTGRAPEGAEALDLPDWLVPELYASLGDQTEQVALALRQRAPVFLRVNLAKTSREAAQAALAAEGIGAEPHPLAASALMVTEGARKVQASKAYQTGLVELQDAASQAVAETLPLRDGMKVLDHCAGGGGKALAMAARAKLRLYAHDIAFGRMRDLPERAKRAGAKVTMTKVPEAEAPFDLVLADAPCSGSGSWRRDPQGKWALTRENLENTLKIQAEILDRIAKLVRPGGVVAYATCSLLGPENGQQVREFLKRNNGFSLGFERSFTPLEGGDGFYIAHLLRAD